MFLTSRRQQESHYQVNVINPPTPTPSWESKSWLLLLLAVSYGVFARLYNLGRWELTIDEYYLVTSIQSILADGLPSFGCGGYYERGLLQQYLTAPLIAYCDNTAFAARLLPALANILAFPVVYKLAQKLVPSRLFAAVATSLFALSLWEIEFARFARMYSLFQLVFIIQLYWLVEIIVEDRIDRYKYLLATTALGIFIYQGMIFSLLLCTLPIILNTRQIKPAHLIGFVVATILIAIRTKIKFRSLFAEPRYPAEYEALGRKGSLPIYTPDFMLGDLTPAWIIAALAVAGLVLWLLIRQAKKQANDPWQNGVLAGVFFCAAIHQFTLALILAIIAACFGIFKQRTRYFGGLILLIIGVLGLFWLLFGILHLDLGVAGTVKALVKYPSIYWYALGPFLIATPRESLILFPVLAIGGMALLRQVARSGKINAPSLLLGIAIMMLVVQSAFVTPEKSTRYTFFLYPALLLLFCYFCFWLPSITRLKTTIQWSACAALLGTYVLVSENYNPRHLLNVSSAEYNFRMPYHRFLQFHFYQRYSYTDVADYVNQNAQEQDLIISTTPVIDYYLDRLDYSYREIGSSWFRDTSACSGTRHIWSHSPLIYTEDNLLKQVAGAHGDSWIITGENGKGQSPEDRFIAGHFEQYLVFTGRDSQLKVYKVPASH